ncbi:MAG TPA: hypothetical protein DCQ30_02145, partial [Acidimicrobiaceae bacterium]|nr:hypothetical protein [Acidimicrobiaceae bacterium]
DRPPKLHHAAVLSHRPRAWDVTIRICDVVRDTGEIGGGDVASLARAADDKGDGHDGELDPAGGSPHPSRQRVAVCRPQVGDPVGAGQILATLTSTELAQAQA